MLPDKSISRNDKETMEDVVSNNVDFLLSFFLSHTGIAKENAVNQQFLARYQWSGDA